MRGGVVGACHARHIFSARGSPSAGNAIREIWTAGAKLPPPFAVEVCLARAPSELRHKASGSLRCRTPIRLESIIAPCLTALPGANARRIPTKNAGWKLALPLRHRERTREEFGETCEYIRFNPSRWRQDIENPGRGSAEAVSGA